MARQTFPGGCDCGRVRYRAMDKPLIVHACHCTRCQRQTGSSNAVNVLVEADNLTLLSGEVIETLTDTPSGSGQTITRCAHCQVAVWSSYLIFKDRRGVDIRFIRAGTLDDPSATPPDVHIFTDHKQPHLCLSDGVPQFPQFYDIAAVWPEESLSRLKALVKRASQRLQRPDLSCATAVD